MESAFMDKTHKPTNSDFDKMLVLIKMDNQHVKT
jgi:hypothetical protein